MRQTASVALGSYLAAMKQGSEVWRRACGEASRCPAKELSRARLSKYWPLPQSSQNSQPLTVVHRQVVEWVAEWVVVALSYFQILVPDQ